MFASNLDLHSDDRPLWMQPSGRGVPFSRPAMVAENVSKDR